MVMGETVAVDALHGEVGVSRCQGDEDGGGAVAVDMAGDEESSMCCSNDFPALPEFTCISSSSSASLPACSTSSSSGSSSWAVVKADVEEGGVGCENMEVAPGPAVEEVVEEEVADMDVLGELGGMAILDDTDMWDPDSLFPGDDGDAAYACASADGGYAVMPGCGGGSVEDAAKPSEDLAMVFFEWLKSNREVISPEDLRSIKLKRSTIESAAKRLGGGREGSKKLLKLILTWVQDHHLQRKHNGYGCYQSSQPNHLLSFPSFDAPTDVWSNGNQHYHGFPDGSRPGYASAMGGYGGGGQGMVVNGGGGFCTDYNNNVSMIDPNNMSWSSSPPAYSSPAYGNSSYSDPSLPPCMGFSGGAGAGGGSLGERFVRLGPSATKEARKKRMARQRRIFTHHSHHHHHQTQHSPRIAGEPKCTSNNNTWVGGYLSSSPISIGTPTSEAGAAAGMSADSPVASQPGQAPLDRSQQGWKADQNNKNLKFLLQKVLKQSDVGNLGRIVLPKREAETHLPLLDSRDGIPIQMEDIGTSRIWNMRYRYWPNNKSRMYLLENTGDFVRSNGLQEGDFIVLFSDVNSGKFMIRGVKVRKSELKSDGRNPTKTQKQLDMNSAGGEDTSTPALTTTSR